MQYKFQECPVYERCATTGKNVVVAVVEGFAEICVDGLHWWIDDIHIQHYEDGNRYLQLGGKRSQEVEKWLIERHGTHIDVNAANEEPDDYSDARRDDILGVQEWAS